MLKVAYVSLAMTASTITHVTLVCRLIVPELPIASPWALKEGVFTKKQSALGKSPLLFHGKASGSNRHPSACFGILSEVSKSHPFCQHSENTGLEDRTFLEDKPRGAVVEEQL